MPRRDGSGWPPRGRRRIHNRSARAAVPGRGPHHLSGEEITVSLAAEAETLGGKGRQDVNAPAPPERGKPPTDEASSMLDTSAAGIGEVEERTAGPRLGYIGQNACSRCLAAQRSPQDQQRRPASVSRPAEAEQRERRCCPPTDHALRRTFLSGWSRRRFPDIYPAAIAARRGRSTVLPAPCRSRSAAPPAAAPPWKPRD